MVPCCKKSLMCWSYLMPSAPMVPGSEQARTSQQHLQTNCYKNWNKKVIETLCSHILGDSSQYWEPDSGSPYIMRAIEHPTYPYNKECRDEKRNRARTSLLRPEDFILVTATEERTDDRC